VLLLSIAGYPNMFIEEKDFRPRLSLFFHAAHALKAFSKRARSASLINPNHTIEPLLRILSEIESSRPAFCTPPAVLNYLTPTSGIIGNLAYACRSAASTVEDLKLLRKANMKVYAEYHDLKLRPGGTVTATAPQPQYLPTPASMFRRTASLWASSHNDIAIKHVVMRHAKDGSVICAVSNGQGDISQWNASTEAEIWQMIKVWLKLSVGKVQEDYAWDEQTTVWVREE
jgi:hypothetical protein